VQTEAFGPIWVGNPYELVASILYNFDPAYRVVFVKLYFSLFANVELLCVQTLIAFFFCQAIIFSFK
jgi:hypothetical protein